MKQGKLLAAVSALALALGAGGYAYFTRERDIYLPRSWCPTVKPPTTG